MPAIPGGGARSGLSAGCRRLGRRGARAGRQGNAARGGPAGRAPGGQRTPYPKGRLMAQTPTPPAGPPPPPGAPGPDHRSVLIRRVLPVGAAVLVAGIALWALF